MFICLLLTILLVIKRLVDSIAGSWIYVLVFMAGGWESTSAL